MMSWTGFIWGLKSVPQSILEEGMHADHHKSVAAAALSAEAAQNSAYSSLRQVVPAAAAIAVATATAAQGEMPKKAEGPAIHKDLSSEIVKPSANNAGTGGDSADRSA
jgi:stearoyl-CoA desaturase (delta-9 desaturase)